MRSRPFRGVGQGPEHVTMRHLLTQLSGGRMTQTAGVRRSKAQDQPLKDRQSLAAERLRKH